MKLKLLRKFKTFKNKYLQKINKMSKKRGKIAKSTLESRFKNSNKGTVEIIIKKKLLGEAPQEHHFVVADGKKLKNIIELADALETMSEAIFAHHVNDARNDFANWIKDVFYDHSLSDDIKRAKDKIETQVVVLRRLVKELL